jgi:SAM-dependent methyltransferase
MAITRIESPAEPWTSERSAVCRGDSMGRFGCAIVMHFGAVESLLDVGAGSGRLQNVLGKACGFYVGVDQVQNEGLLQADAHSLPFPDRSFDVVVSKQTLPHFAEPAKALAEMMRVAKRGVVIQQEFPLGGVGWDGHSLVHYDGPDDVLELLPGATFDGLDFVWRRP